MYEVHDWPELHEPILVVALEGWIDAANAAGAALAVLDRECAARPVVTFDADRFLDYRARRPVMQLRDGINIGLVWPELVMKAGRTPAGRDVVILGGHEPDMQWRAFCEAVLELSGRLGVTRMIGLGAYPIAVPHTRPSRLSMSCSTPEAAVGLPYQRNSVDVAAGAGAALEQTLATAGISAMTLWAQVPHYLASAPYPGATVALLEGLASVAGVEVDVTELRTEAAATRTRVDGLVVANPEHLQMLRQLESFWDETATSSGSPMPEGPLPSGDELAAELEQFLRDQS